MKLSAPEPGLVIRYAYLWRHEAAGGRDEGSKERPAVVILAVRDADGETRVYVVPITLSTPADPAQASRFRQA